MQADHTGQGEEIGEVKGDIACLNNYDQCKNQWQEQQRKKSAHEKNRVVKEIETSNRYSCLINEIVGDSVQSVAVQAFQSGSVLEVQSGAVQEIKSGTVQVVQSVTVQVVQFKKYRVVQLQLQ